MKKVALLAALSFGTTGAAAPQLYTITVTADNFRPGMTLGILPLDKANEKYFKKVAASTAVFKVPAGKYAISLMQTAESEKKGKFAEPNFKDIVVKGNMNVRISGKYMPEIPYEDTRIINKYLIMMSAIVDACEKPESNSTCARSGLSVEALAAATQVITEWEQVDPWVPYYTTGRLGFFEINGREYLLTIEPQGSGTRLTWRRNR